MNQSLRIRKSAIPAAHHPPEVCSFSTFSTIYMLYTIYANYFHFDGKPKKIQYAHSKSAGESRLFNLSPWHLYEETCLSMAIAADPPEKVVDLTRGHF